MPPCPTSFLIFVETGFHYVAQAGFKLLSSSDPPALASQRVRISGMSYCAQHKPSVSDQECLGRNLPVTKSGAIFGWAGSGALWEAKAGGLSEVRSSRPTWRTWQNPVSTKNTKISQAWWHTPVVPATRPRWVDHLRSGVQDQSGQDGEMLLLLKIQKLACVVGMGTEIVGDVAQCIIRVICNQAMETILSAETNHFLMVIFNALCNLANEKKTSSNVGDPQAARAPVAVSYEGLDTETPQQQDHTSAQTRVSPDTFSMTRNRGFSLKTADAGEGKHKVQLKHLGNLNVMTHSNDISKKKSLSSGTVAHTCNPTTLESRGRWIMRSGIQDQPGQHGETPSLLKIPKLAGHGAGANRDSAGRLHPRLKHHLTNCNWILGGTSAIILGLTTTISSRGSGGNREDGISQTFSSSSFKEMSKNDKMEDRMARAKTPKRLPKFCFQENQ
ncbi:Zinc finger protein 714 [Plecturocebus cupreus]